MNMIIINPLDLLDTFKFGYQGETIDLIYLLLWGWTLFYFFRWLFKLIKGGVLND